MSLVFEYNHQPIISWKGKTFNQITSSIKKNRGLINTTNTHNLLKPNPLKIYRREIATPIQYNDTTCSKKVISIDEIDRPGGTIINTAFNNNNGIKNTIDDTIPNNLCENPATCNIFASPAQNALRKLRSAGMIRQKFDNKNRPKYCTDTTQYLVSRNIAFEQNQYQYPISDPSYCVTNRKKFNNQQFAQQGAVTSSSLTTRKIYNTINTAAAQTALPLGIATANALAYGVPQNGYTIKDIIGYPNKSCVIKGGKATTCINSHIRG